MTAKTTQQFKAEYEKASDRFVELIANLEFAEELVELTDDMETALMGIVGYSLQKSGEKLQNFRTKTKL